MAENNDSIGGGSKKGGVDESEGTGDAVLVPQRPKVQKPNPPPEPSNG